MRKPLLPAPRVAGLLVAMLGAIVAVRWVFQMDMIARLIPGSENMGIVNPLLFIAIGICFFAVPLPLPQSPPQRPWLRRVSLVCTGTLLVLPLAYLFESATNISLGVDIVSAGTVPTARNPNPGRISPNASLAFLLAGVAFGLLRQPLVGRRRTLYLALVLCVAIISVGGLAGHFLGLETLYQVANFNRILAPTAFGLSIVAAGLWLLHDQSLAFDPHELGEAQQRIKRRSVAVITLVAVSCGVAGFAAMRDTFEQSISQNMLLTATTTATSLGHAIDVSLWFPRTMASRPTVRQTLDKLGKNPNDAEAKDFLQKIADSFLTAEITGVQLHNAEGVLTVSAGSMVRSKAQVVYPLRNADQTAFLAWQDGYLLVAENDVVSDGRTVGRVFTEQRLPLFDQLLADVRAANDSSDSAICGREGDNAVCAPTKFNRARFDFPMFDAAGQVSLPIVKALLGEHGVSFARDPRNIEVVSAYAPIKNFGLGMNVKTDVDTLYAPLRSRFAALVLAIAAIIALAIYAQRSQVRPVLMRLVESEQRIKSILEDQSELVSLANVDGKLTYVNPAYARHFGLMPSDMVGGNLFDHVEPADLDTVKATVASVLTSGISATSENRMVEKDGAERWVSWTNSLQIDSSGVRLLHSVGRDITERKQAELALSTSRAVLERTGKVAGVGGWELDLRTQRLDWTDETRRVHDVGPDYVATVKGAVGFYVPESQAIITSAVERGSEQGTPWDLELPMVTATGRHIWVRAQGQAEYEDGRPVRLVGAVQDITERKSLEQRLAESEKFVRQVTDSLPVRIAYVDREMRYRFVNLAHCRRFGLPRDRILGRTRDEMRTDRGAAVEGAVDEAVSEVLAGREQRLEFEEVVEGKLVRIESRFIPDLGNDGQVHGFYSTGIDITERAAAERALRELTTIFDNTTDFVVQADWRGNVAYMNPAVRQVLGIGLDESVTHRNVGEFNTPETNQLFVEVIMPTTKAKGVWVGETTVYAADKRVVPVNHMVIAHRETDGRISRYSAIMRDITDELSAKQQQSRQAATLRSVTEAIPATVAVVGVDGRYRFVNSGFERWSGSHRGSIVGRTLQEVLGRTEHERSRPWIERVLAGETVNFEKEYTGRTVARHLAISYVPLWLDSGEVDGFIAVAQDITLHKQEEVRLLHLTQRDTLTGLLNRAGFEQYLESKLREEGSAQTLALLYVDLDHFKPVNDTHGHPVGDEVLRLFAERLLNTVRPTDAVARLGGDEFAIALAGVREGANANAVADKVIAAAQAPFEVGPLVVSIGASVGVAFGADSAVGWRDLVARADAMLYRAKAAGRGQHAGII